MDWVIERLGEISTANGYNTDLAVAVQSDDAQREGAAPRIAVYDAEIALASFNKRDAGADRLDIIVELYTTGHAERRALQQDVATALYSRRVTDLPANAVAVYPVGAITEPRERGTNTIYTAVTVVAEFAYQRGNQS